MILKSLQVLACLVSQGGKTTTLPAFLAQFLAGGSRFTWWTVENELRLFLTSYNVPLESPDVLSMLGYVVAQMEQREDFLGKKERQGRLETPGLAGGTCSAEWSPSR